MRPSWTKVEPSAWEWPLARGGPLVQASVAGVVDVDPRLVELLAVVVELAGDGVDLPVEGHARELVARHRHRRRRRPSGAAVRLPRVEVEHPVVGRVGVAVLLDAAHVVQPAGDEGEAAAAPRLRQQRGRGVAVEVDVVAPHLGDGVAAVAVLEPAREPHGAAVEHHVHVGDGARQVLDARPAPVGRIEDVRQACSTGPRRCSRRTGRACRRGRRCRAPTSRPACRAASPSPGRRRSPRPAGPGPARPRERFAFPAGSAMGRRSMA